MAKLCPGAAAPGYLSVFGVVHMADSVKWILSSGDVTVEITAVLNGSGDVEFEYKLVSGIADLNGFYVDIGNDGGGISKLGRGNNMKGRDSDGDALDGFDVAEKIGTAGGNDDDTTEGTLTYSLAELGISSLEELADAEIGIRATSVGEYREDSLKLAGTGEFCPDEDPDGDDFPEWGQDISNITFVFNQSEGDTSGDGFYTVKVNVPGELGDDPDEYIEDLLEDLIAFDPNLEPDADLEGIVLKGGMETTEFFAYGSHNMNGEDPDPLPVGIGFSLPGDHGNVVPVNEIDVDLDLSISGDDFLFS
ncbi:hypothetical protein RA20_21225 [Leisingera sp. ANG-Vp]|nr:hypothetical protein RA20_21225 [Leisingera sp. ANG-Vp]